MFHHCTAAQNRLWFGFDIADAITSPSTRIANHSRNNHGLGGIVFEQELPHKLSVMTGIKISRYWNVIDLPVQQGQEYWNAPRTEFSCPYIHIPVLLRRQLPFAHVFKRKLVLYTTPHAGFDLNFSGKNRGTLYSENKTIPDEVVEIHQYPHRFFVNGNVGLALGFESEYTRLEFFSAFAFHGGRMLDFSLKEPYPNERTYIGINTLQFGARIVVCLVNWNRIAERKALRKAGRNHEKRNEQNE